MYALKGPFISAQGKAMRVSRVLLPPWVVGSIMTFGRIIRLVYQRHVDEAEIHRGLLRPRQRSADTLRFYFGRLASLFHIPRVATRLAELA